MKNFYKIVISIIFIIITIMGIVVSKYFIVQKNNEKYIEICKNNNEYYSDPIEETNDLNKEFVGVINSPKSCYCRMYTHLLPRLLVYKIQFNKKDLEFIRPTRGICILPTIILEKADAFISYGTADNIDFENSISKSYKKYTYIYESKNKNFNLNNEYIFFKNNNLNFKKRLKELKLEDKKIYVKINEGISEVDVIPEIIEHYKHITGISFMIRLYNSNQIIELEKLLKQIEKNFILVSRTELSDKKYCDCDYKNKDLATVISLTYINKEYADKKNLPFKQSYNEKTNYKQLYNLGNYIPKFGINWGLILSEKIRLLF